MVGHFKAVHTFAALRVLSAVVDVNDPSFSHSLRCSARAKGYRQVCAGLEPSATPGSWIRRNPKGKDPAPTQPAFCRLLQRVDARRVEEVILAIQEQIAARRPKIN